MSKFTPFLLGVALISDVYASICAIRSYSKFNNCINKIAHADIRDDALYLAKTISEREL